MRTLFTIVLAIVFSAVSAALADNRVTILSPGSATRVDFKRMHLAVDSYPADDLRQMGTKTLTSLTESLDNSRLLIFGEQTHADVFKAIFDSSTLTTSLKNFLQRGGTIYVGPVSWSILGHLPGSMRRFFKQNNVFLPAAGNYGTDSDHPTRPMQVFANPHAGELPLLHTPNDLSKGKWRGATAIHYYVKFPAESHPILVGSPDDRAAVLLQENVAGKGRVIFSMAYSITRMARSPFMENLAADLFGDWSQAAAATAAVRAPLPKFLLHLKAATAPMEVDGQLGDAVWKSAAEASLRLRDGKTPTKPTQARVGFNKSNLLFAFKCEEPNMGGLKAEHTNRDGSLWKDDCVEVAIQPEGGQIYHWIVSASGALFDEAGGNAGWNSHATAAVAKQADSWTVELSIPLSDVFADGKLPDQFKLNLAREEQQAGEISSWVTPIDMIAAPTSLGYATTLDPADFSKEWNQTVRPVVANAGEWTVWTRSAWRSSPAPSLPPPEKAGKLNRLDLVAPGRGHDSAVLFISNPGAEPLTLTLKRSADVSGPEGKTLPFDQLFKLYRAAPRLNSYQQITYDPLVELNPLDVLTVPAGRNVMLWLAAAGDAPAGQYSAGIELMPITVEKPKARKIKIHLTIAPVSLPDSLPVQVYTWGPYRTALVQGHEKAYARMAHDFHINNLYVGFPFGSTISKDLKISANPADYLGVAPMYAQHANLIYSYGIFLEFDRQLRRCGFKGKEFDDQWQALFLQWATRWLDALKQAGIGPDRFHVQVEDEPRPEHVPLLIKETAFFKAHFPQLRLMVDMGAWNTKAHYEALAPYISLFIPHQSRITRRDTAASELSFYQKHGPFWPYLCATRMDVQPLLAYYRYRGIKDWSLGASGIALWAFNSWSGNPWSQWDVIGGSHQNKYDECLFYSTPTGPTPSIRAMAFRQGIEDFALLKMLQEKRGVATPAALLKTLPESLNPMPVLSGNDPAKVGAWRAAMLKALQ